MSEDPVRGEGTSPARAGEAACALIRRTRQVISRKFLVEEKIRIVLEGIRGEVAVSELCRREGNHPAINYISNDAGHVKMFLLLVFLRSAHPSIGAHTPFPRRVIRGNRRSLSFLSSLSARPALIHRFGVAHQTSLRSLGTMMISSNSPRFREAGDLFKWPVTARQDLCSSQASPHGQGRFLPSLSAAAELLVIDLVTRHDPEPNPEFASCGDSRLSQSFLDQFAPIEAFQFRISPYGVHRRLAPQKSQQGVALLAECAQPLSAPAGGLPGDHPNVAGHRFAIGEPHRITQVHFGGQHGDGPDPWMRHQPSRLRTSAGLSADLLIEVIDRLLQSMVQGHANIQTTLNAYTQAVTADKRDTASKVGDVLWRM